MRVALVQELGGIDRVELGERPDPAPAARQVLVRVQGAGVGPWDVGFLSGGFPGLALPFVPGQEVAGVVEAAGDGAGVQPGKRMYASLFPAGGGFAELALASADRLAVMPSQASFADAAGLVIGGGTAHEGLVDHGKLRADETVLITAAAGGVGSAAVQIAAAMGACPLGVASPPNHHYLRSLGASEVFDYHAADWVQQVRAAVPGGVDLLLDGARGQTRDQAVGAIRDGGRAIFIVLAGPQHSSSAASRANRSPPTSTASGWRHCAAWSSPAHCAPRSRQCRWSRRARRWPGSPTSTPAARSCCRSGSSGDASELSLPAHVRRSAC
jgi:NADPH2:quinone reductase